MTKNCSEGWNKFQKKYRSCETRRNLFYTYYLSNKDHIFSSDKKNPSGNITILPSHMNSLNGILQQKVGWKSNPIKLIILLWSHSQFKEWEMVILRLCELARRTFLWASKAFLAS